MLRRAYDQAGIAFPENTGIREYREKTRAEIRRHEEVMRNV